MKEIGNYQIQDMNSWSAKTPKIAANGDFYLYGNDIARGLDVYKFTAAGTASTNQGRWMSPAEAQAAAAARPKVALSPDTAFYCLLPR